MNRVKEYIRKYVPFVTAVWAAFCPICYIAPLLIGAGAGSTLIFTALWGEKILITLILLSIVGFYFSYKSHRNLLPIGIGIVSGGLMYYSRYINYNISLLYVGSISMMGAAITDILFKRKTIDDCESCKDISKKKHHDK